MPLNLRRPLADLLLACQRHLRRLLATAALLACAAAPAMTQPKASVAATPEADPATFAACLKTLRPQALAAGVSAAQYDTHTAGLEPDVDVLVALDAQPEFVTPIWDYLAALVDEERVADGRAMLAQWADVLDRVQARHGVDPETIVAVWGVESNFGRNFGKRPLLRSLSTLSCFGRRQNYFRGEFITTLQIIEQGHVAPERLVGSWAGAFGHTQFMPSTFMRVAVDFDGDGRRDLVESIPDALASTANFLRDAGWRTGQSWGHEVRLPAGFDVAAAGRRNRRPIRDWLAAGVRSVDGQPLGDDSEQAAVIVPAGPAGPAFLVRRNFNALYAYNAAESYALAIAHLSDRLRGGGPFSQAWPTDDPGLSRMERRELQRLLLDAGHDIGEADGVIGARTREALRKALAASGIESDGRAGRKALERLRSGAGARQTEGASSSQ